MLSEFEKKLVDMLYGADCKAERISDREFDLKVFGRHKEGALAGVEFEAWLPLAAIKELINWRSHRVAQMCNYPMMAQDGDWSAIRDSEESKIWQIFEKFYIAKERGEVEDWRHLQNIYRVAQHFTQRLLPKSKLNHHIAERFIQDDRTHVAMGLCDEGYFVCRSLDHKNRPVAPFQSNRLEDVIPHFIRMIFDSELDSIVNILKQGDWFRRVDQWPDPTRDL